MLATLYIQKRRLDKAEIQIKEHDDCFEIILPAEPDKEAAIMQSHEQLRDAGFNPAAIGEFLDQLVSFENTLAFFKLTRE